MLSAKMTSPTLVLSVLLATAHLTSADGPLFGGILASDTESWYEANYGVLVECIYDSIPHLNLTATTLEQAKELRDNFEKITGEYNISHSLPAAATLFQAEKLMHNNDIEQNIEVVDILKNIINKSSIFAKNLISGYGCHSVAAIRYPVDGKEMEPEENDQYIVFYNPEEPTLISTSKVVPKADGDKILITAGRNYNGVDLQYSILLDNADYPENIRMLGNIISKKVIESEEATNEGICAEDSKPEPLICIPMSKILSWTLRDASQNPDARYKALEKYIKFCK